MTRSVVLSLATFFLVGCSALSGTGHQDGVYERQHQALAAYDADESAKAESLFLGLLRTSPNDSLSWFYLGNLYARTDRPEQAIEAYQKSLMLNGSDPRPWHNIGVIRLRQARAAFIQTFDLSRPEEPLHRKAETLIEAMGNIPIDTSPNKPEESGGDNVRP